MNDITFIYKIQDLHPDWTFDQCRDWYYERDEEIKYEVQKYIHKLLEEKLK